VNENELERKKHKVDDNSGKDDEINVSERCSQVRHCHGNVTKMDLCSLKISSVLKQQSVEYYIPINAKTHQIRH
jgi:hypothetical protein